MINFTTECRPDVPYGVTGRDDIMHIIAQTNELQFLDFLCLIGSVGLFLYGMKVMSEGLQKAAGDRLRNILSAMTRNRFTGTITGFAITALIQNRRHRR